MISFKAGKKIVMTFLIATGILFFVSFALNGLGNESFIYFAYGALATLIITIVVGLTSFKCPHCGEKVYAAAFKAETCPHCKRNME